MPSGAGCMESLDPGLCDGRLLHLPPDLPRIAVVSQNRSHLLVWLVCIAVLVMRIGAVHMHFCADGSEPPVSLHVGDDGIHDLDHPKGVGVNAFVSDSDMSVAGDALVKKLDVGVDLPPLAIAFTLLLFVVATVRSVRFDWGPSFVRISDPTLLRPPLRGPPV